MLDQVVCGVSGDVSSPIAKDFLKCVRAGRLLVQENELAVCSNQATTEITNGLFWEPALDTNGAVHWTDISQDRFAAGLVRENGAWILFNDVLGAHPTFVRELAGSFYFSNRLQPLVDLPGKLHVDWTAWADIFQLGGILGAATHFEEIQRVPARTGLKLTGESRGRQLTYNPNWLRHLRQTPSPQDIVRAVQEALPKRGLLQKPPAVTLSGGWDSRLLAALARDQYRRKFKAWTADQDDGTDDDVTYAKSVARALSVRHLVVDNDETPWSQLAIEARGRMEYQTWLHPWLIPLRHRMQPGVGELIDGLAGDVLIKGLYVDSDLLAADSGSQVDALFKRLGGGPERHVGRFSDGFSDVITSATRSKFMEISAEYADHPNQLALTILHTRTARAIALSPLRLFGPEMVTWLPFVDSTVLDLTLSIPPHEKTNGHIYRQVLESGAHKVKDLPSTNDNLTRHRAPLPRRQGGPEAISWMIGSVLESAPALELMSPRLRQPLETEGIRWIPPDFWTAQFLQVVSLFAQWETAHRHKLESVAIPT